LDDTLTKSADKSSVRTNDDTPAAEAGDEAQPFNTVGLISLILTAVSGGLCTVMFWLADGLPDNPADFSDEATTPAQLRLLILACSTGLLAVVAFVMGLVALLLPNPNKTMALLAVVGSTLILLRVCGVIILAIIMANYQEAAEAVTAML